LRPEPGASEGWRAALPYAAVFLAAALACLQALHFGFTWFDDDLLLERAAHFAGPGGLLSVFTEGVFPEKTGPAFYRPLMMLLMALEYKAAGAAPLLYHLTNLLLHASFCTLLLFFLRRSGGAPGLSLFWTLFFAWHPALGQAVAWLPGRNDLLLGIFALGGILSYVSYEESGGAGRLALHAVLFLAALLVKESAVLIPFAAFFYAGLYRGGRRRTGRLSYAAAVWGCAAGLVWLARSRALAGHGGEAAFAASALSNAAALLPSLGKFLWPSDNGVLPLMADLDFISGGISAAVLALLAWRLRPDRPLKLVYGAAWFSLFLLPAFMQSNFSPHRLYLPFAGLCLALCAPARPLPGEAKPWAFAGGAVLLAWFFGLQAVLPRFAGRISFWENAAVSSPARATNWSDLGAMYLLEGRAAQAHGAFLKALELDPRNDGATFDLGVLAMSAGDPASAEKWWARTVEINPDYLKARHNLVLLALARGDRREALRQAGELRRAAGGLPPELEAALAAPGKK
jgi:tetratricopeptide (TPR) repeat protein